MLKGIRESEDTWFRKTETDLVCGEVRGGEIDSVTCVAYSLVDGEQNRKRFKIRTTLQHLHFLNMCLSILMLYSFPLLAYSDN
jgi:hypothetical protein